MAKSPLNRKILSLILYVFLALIFAYGLTEKHSPTLSVGSAAPIDEKVNLLSGGSIPIRRFLRKPLVVNFWASWCASCLKDLPTLVHLAKKYHGRLGFLNPAFATDVKDIQAIKRQFMTDIEFTLADEALINKWQARVFPTTYVINRHGIITWAKIGTFREKELEDALESVLKK